MPAERPLIAGTGRESTKATIAATARAAAAGVDAVLVRTPSFFKAQMDADVFVRHYTEVADASLVPVLLYNVSMFTGVTMQVEAVERLSAHPNIVGMKESGSDIAYITELVLRTPDDFTMLAGSATTFFHALCAGCAVGSLRSRRCCPMRACACRRSSGSNGLPRRARCSIGSCRWRARSAEPTAWQASRPRST